MIPMNLEDHLDCMGFSFYEGGGVIWTFLFVVAASFALAWFT